MKELNFLDSINPVKKSIISRKKNKSKLVIAKSRLFGRDYFDGQRKYGYGGYIYDGRWKTVSNKIVHKFKLNSKSKLLDIGCAKGFLVSDLLDLGIDAFGIDISEYALRKSLPNSLGRLHLGNATSLPFPNNTFDAVISINTIHNLNQSDCIKSIKEINRVCKTKNKYIQVDCYDTPDEVKNFKDWVLTAKTHGDKYFWLKLFKKAKYDGYYNWTKV